MEELVTYCYGSQRETEFASIVIVSSRTWHVARWYCHRPAWPRPPEAMSVCRGVRTVPDPSTQRNVPMDRQGQRPHADKLNGSVDGVQRFCSDSHWAITKCDELLRYVTIRYRILTCTQKLAGTASLIYRTEPEQKEVMQGAKTKTDVLRRNGPSYRVLSFSK